MRPPLNARSACGCSQVGALAQGDHDGDERRDDDHGADEVEAPAIEDDHHCQADHDGERARPARGERDRSGEGRK